MERTSVLVAVGGGRDEGDGLQGVPGREAERREDLMGGLGGRGPRDGPHGGLGVQGAEWKQRFPSRLSRTPCRRCSCSSPWHASSRAPPPASASQSAGLTGVCRRARPSHPRRCGRPRSEPGLPRAPSRFPKARVLQRPFWRRRPSQAEGTCRTLIGRRRSRAHPPPITLDGRSSTCYCPAVAGGGTPSPLSWSGGSCRGRGGHRG